MSISRLAIVLDVRRRTEMTHSITYMMTVMIMADGIGATDCYIQTAGASLDATDGMMGLFRTIRRKKTDSLLVGQIQIETEPMQCSGGMNALEPIVITM